MNEQTIYYKADGLLLMFLYQPKFFIHCQSPDQVSFIMVMLRLRLSYDPIHRIYNETLSVFNALDGLYITRIMTYRKV